MSFLPTIIILLAAIISALKDFVFGEQKTRKQKYFSFFVFIFLVLSAFGALWQSISSDQKSKKIDQQQSQIIQQNDELVTKSKKIEQLNDYILSSVTGGDSCCYLLPMFDEMNNVDRFMIMHDGEYPVFDVEIQITDQTLYEKLPFDSLFPNSQEELEQIGKNRDLWQEYNEIKSKAQLIITKPTVFQGAGNIINFKKRSEDATEQEYQIRIFMRNGQVNEIIKTMKINGKWKTALRATWQSNSGKGHRVVKEWLIPDIALDW